VNVKKGQFMSPENMKGAVDKLAAAGCPFTYLTERGSFFGYGDLVVDMRSLTVMNGFCDGVIMDLTHSLQKPGAAGRFTGGDRTFALQMARAAAAWGIQGMFIEVHPEPESALSDSAVMLNFKDAEIYMLPNNCEFCRKSKNAKDERTSTAISTSKVKTGEKMKFRVSFFSGNSAQLTESEFLGFMTASEKKKSIFHITRYGKPVGLSIKDFKSYDSLSLDGKKVYEQ